MSWWYGMSEQEYEDDMEKLKEQNEALERIIVGKNCLIGTQLGYMETLLEQIKQHQKDISRLVLNKLRS